MIGERRCSRCGVTKPAADFSPRRDKHGEPRWRRSHCKACSNAFGRITSRRRAADNPKREMLAAARKRARITGVPFDLEESDVEIPATCPVLNIPLVMSRGRRGPRDASPTLDRIICSRGYVRGNVVVISWRANRLKSDATVEELARIVEWFRTIASSAERPRQESNLGPPL